MVRERADVGSYEDIVAAAQRTTGLTDFGSDLHEEGLRVLVDDLSSPEAGLTPRGNYFQRSEVKSALVGVLLTQSAFTRFPAYADVPIERPVFLMGLPRTGTTALHRYLHADPATQGLEMWLTQYPQPRPPRETWEDDPIFQAMQAGFAAHHVAAPDFMGIHYMDATTVEECWRLLRQTGKSNSYESLANLPRYSQWLQQQSWVDAYERHRANLQLVGLNDPEKRWILKNPSHMTALDALMTVYPDALVVYTHRDPVTCIASSCSLSAETTAGQSETYVGGVIGHTQLVAVVAGLPRVPRRAPGVPGRAVRRRRLLRPARRPARRDPRDLRAVRAAWTAEARGRDHRPGPRVEVRRRGAQARLLAQGLRPVRASGEGGVRPVTPRKRVVVWGTGVVGKLVIAEIVEHPAFELVGVGVSNPAKVGLDACEICGTAPPSVVRATDSVEELIALRPDAVVHYGPTAQYADENIRVISAFLRAGIDVCSTAMTPWVWPTMAQTPAAWIDPITAACAEGGASCFTTGIDPGFANDLFPLTLMGLCGEVRSVRASELLDYTDYEGDYEDEMGIGRPPSFTPLLEIPGC